MDRASFPAMHTQFAERFAAKIRDEWTEIFTGIDAYVTPVLTWSEAARSEHLRARKKMVTRHGVEQAAPAPRLSRTPPDQVGAPPKGATPVRRIGW
jgi:alpha-methylacyl-CoA racemase